MAWNLWLNTNKWVVLLMKPKALTLVRLINYITNYIKIIYLIIFWYYLLAPVGNHWKQTHLERNVPAPLEQSLFYQIHTLITGKRSILAKMVTFFWKRALFLKERPQNFITPYSIPFLRVLHQIKVLHNFYKRGQHSIVETLRRSRLGPDK